MYTARLGTLALALLLCLVSQNSNAQQPGEAPALEMVGCAVDGQSVEITLSDGKVISYACDDAPGGCLIVANQVLIAQGPEGVGVYQLLESGDRVSETSRWKQPGVDVLGLKVTDGIVFAVTAQYSFQPLTVGRGGNIKIASALDLLGEKGHATGRRPVPSVPAIAPERAGNEQARADKPEPQVANWRPSKLSGEVLEVHPDTAIIALGEKHGVTEGMRFEILAQRKVKRFNLTTGKTDLLPANDRTGVVQVVQVSPEKSLVRLDKGDLAAIGDKVLVTDLSLNRTASFPPQHRQLHRLQGRIAPFLGLGEGLDVGALVNLLYDYAFQMPFRIETGFRNVGLVFGDGHLPAVPFQFDVIPSFDTDVFEVGLGVGYSYTSHHKKRGFTLLQKVRLGAQDGASITLWNSFMYQQRHPEYFDDVNQGWPVSKDGENDWELGRQDGGLCHPDLDEYEGSTFVWKGVDVAAELPVSPRISLVSTWGYSQTGWFHGDIGIKALLRGNGGDGTLILPVTVGGAAIRDFSGTSVADLRCDPKLAEGEELGEFRWYKSVDYESTWYAGPFVSIGLDYRWR